MSIELALDACTLKSSVDCKLIGLSITSGCPTLHSIKSSIEGYEKVNEEMLAYILNLQKKDPIGIVKSNFKGWHSKDFNMKDHKDFKKDWLKINDEQVNYFIDKGCERRCVTCKAGSLVLWDSRLMHCGKEPLKDRKEQKFRNVAYICMMPRTLCSHANIKKRINFAY